MNVLRPIATIVRLWLRQDLLVVTVEGDSMLPTLQSGDRLYCSKSAVRERGKIVIRKTPSHLAPYHVKWLKALPGDSIRGLRVPSDNCWLEGEDRQSADSRQFGPIPLNEIIAVAVVRWRVPSTRDALDVL